MLLTRSARPGLGPLADLALTALPASPARAPHAGTGRRVQVVRGKHLSSPCTASWYCEEGEVPRVGHGHKVTWLDQHRAGLILAPWIQAGRYLRLLNKLPPDPVALNGIVQFAGDSWSGIQVGLGWSSVSGTADRVIDWPHSAVGGWSTCRPCPWVLGLPHGTVPLHLAAGFQRECLEQR